MAPNPRLVACQRDSSPPGGWGLHPRRRPDPRLRPSYAQRKPVAVGLHIAHSSSCAHHRLSTSVLASLLPILQDFAGFCTSLRSCNPRFFNVLSPLFSLFCKFCRKEKVYVCVRAHAHTRTHAHTHTHSIGLCFRKSCKIAKSGLNLVKANSLPLRNPCKMGAKILQNPGFSRAHAHACRRTPTCAHARVHRRTRLHAHARTHDPSACV
jgi:hypothetical protein